MTYDSLRMYPELDSSEAHVPFTHRYGLREHSPEVWMYAGRHAKTGHGEISTQCPEPELWRCRCPGVTGEQCCLQMDQEDLLCRDCRQWCVGVDDHQVLHRFLDWRPLGVAPESHVTMATQSLIDQGIPGVIDVIDERQGPLRPFR